MSAMYEDLVRDRIRQIYLDAGMRQNRPTRAVRRSAKTRSDTRR